MLTKIDNISTKNPDGQVYRPRVMQFPSGVVIEPDWTWNDLIDERHLSDLLLSGARPAIASVDA